MRSLLLVPTVALLASCGSFFSSSDEAPRGAGLEANLRGTGGSALHGSVRFVPRSGGVTMLVQLSGVPAGQYRILVHANGNCTSPNGFSAGPPWSPPGMSPPLPDRLPPLSTNTEGTGTMTVRLSGLALEGPNGLAGKSVVVHEGARGPFEAQPDVPNKRAGCGVLGPLETVF